MDETFKGIMLSEIKERQTAYDLMKIWNLKHLTYRNREKMGGCREGEGWVKALKTSSFKLNKLWGFSEQYGDHS